MKKNSSDIIVNFSNVTKQYGDLIVLDNLNLEIKILFTSAAYEDASGKNRGWIARGGNSFNNLSRTVLMTRHPIKENYRIIEDGQIENLMKISKNGFFPAS